MASVLPGDGDPPAVIITDPVPFLGHPVALVDREQLRVTQHGRTLMVPDHLQAITVPSPPSAFDLSQNDAVKLPILGNDRQGDCYMAAALHIVQLMRWNAIKEQVNWNVSDVLKWYNHLSGGDRGLGDQQIFPDWKRGELGPAGPFKILDWMTIRPSDDASIDLGMWAFNGVLFTMSLPGSWHSNAAPNVIWSANNASRPIGGHAVILYGKNPVGNRILGTWGIQPGIQLTRDGLLAVDPEIVVVFSLDMFDKTGIAPCCGLDYTALAALWQQLGGKPLPPSPFGPPPPPPPPDSPVAPNTIRLLKALKAGANGDFVLGSDLPPGDYECVLSGDGPPPVVPG